MKNLHSKWVAAAALLMSASAQADHTIEEIVVLERHDSRVIDVIDAVSVAPDPSRLLYKSPGANVTTNGPITGIPQIRGLFGPRIAVTLDNSFLAPAGPNWMDPPLSYAVTAQLMSLKVYRGITPVSIAQESLGGVISAQSYRKTFGSGASWELEGRVQGSAQSAAHAYQWDLDLQAANQHHRVKFAGMGQSGSDTRFPDGSEIAPSSYERTRFDAGYGFQSGKHSFQIDVGHTDTGESGTPALPMDIDYFKGNLVNTVYSYALNDGIALSASLFASDLDHGMTNYQLRPSPAAPGRWRQNIATTSNRGLRLQADIDLNESAWRAGIDGFTDEHDSNIDNPNNPMFFVVNFNQAERSVLGAYLEQDLAFNETLTGEWGLRVNRAVTDAGEVNATPAMMMPPAAALRDQFNNADRRLSDLMVDVFAKLSLQVTDDTSAYVGLARKQRAPAYQERYLWLPLEATAGLADGQLYVGDINLKPETAGQFEAGLDYRSSHFNIHPRVFYQRIDDFIQGTPALGNTAAISFVGMMNQSNGTNRPDPLQFGNVDAELYGFDLDWHWQMSRQWHVGGVMSVVHGKRRDIDDNLYRIAPPNASVVLTHQRESWAFSAETIAYSDQDDVSVTNRERTTPGYALLNLTANWQVNHGLDLFLGVDNVFDRRYTPHLGGYNRAGNPDVGLMDRLPAAGINVFGRVNYVF